MTEITSLLACIPPSMLACLQDILHLEVRAIFVTLEIRSYQPPIQTPSGRQGRINPDLALGPAHLRHLLDLPVFLTSPAPLLSAYFSPETPAFLSLLGDAQFICVIAIYTFRYISLGDYFSVPHYVLFPIHSALCEAVNLPQMPFIITLIKWLPSHCPIFCIP